MLVGGLATVYGLWLCYAADLQYLLVATILFAPATILFIMARRERGERVFAPAEVVVALAITAAAVFAIYQLVPGDITI